MLHQEWTTQYFSLIPDQLLPNVPRDGRFNNKCQQMTLCQHATLSMLASGVGVGGAFEKRFTQLVASVEEPLVLVFIVQI